MEDLESNFATSEIVNSNEMDAAEPISENRIYKSIINEDGMEETIPGSFLFQHSETKKYGSWKILLLAYQTLGVVYGDLGTSPLYVFPSVSIEMPNEKDILGIFSLIFWTLTLIALVKYVFIVLRADDHGEGGTFAIYSLLCQHVNIVGKSTGEQFRRLPSDANLKFFSKGHVLDISSKTKQMLEKSSTAQRILLVFVMLGTSMVIGDGALTPAISVLSAIQGIQSKNPKMSQDIVVLVSVVILVLLFLLQNFGTSKVSFLFSPIMVMWFSSTAIIGAYNIGAHYPGVFKALSPYYIFYFFAENHKQGWVMLGAVFLCVTGAEAMFADLGHFNKRSIQIAFSLMVYPALILTYAGQAAYLIKNPGHISDTFYKSIPNAVYWPMFIVATLAAIVASQALISATFSIIKQSMALGCFPRVNIVHTSQDSEGQIYSPEVNYVLMILCLAIVVGFRGGPQIGNAFGVAVAWVMLITTCLVTLVMLVIWNIHIVFIAAFFLFFGLVEGIYMTAMLNKVPQGGWVPFVISAVFLVIMLSWSHGRQKKYKYELERKMQIEDLRAFLDNMEISRVPGVCFFCSNIIYGLPPIVNHYVTNVNSLHKVTIILTIRFVPVKTVLSNERFHVAKLCPKGVYRCLAQYGYNDVPNVEGHEFLNHVIGSIKDHVRLSELSSLDIEMVEASNFAYDDELRDLDLAMSKGAIFVTGRTTLRTSPNTSGFQRFVIDKLYRFLQDNCRSSISTLNIPPAQLFQVGMLYEM